MSYLAGPTKYKVLFIVLAAALLVGAAWATPSKSGSTRLNTGGAYGNNTAMPLNDYNASVNGTVPNGNASSDNNSSPAAGSTVPGSVPPSGSGSGSSSSNVSPTPVMPADPEVRYPTDPTPKTCFPLSGSMMACRYCGNPDLKYPCGGCGYGNVQPMCYPLDQAY